MFAQDENHAKNQPLYFCLPLNKFLKHKLWLSRKIIIYSSWPIRNLLLIAQDLYQQIFKNFAFCFCVGFGPAGLVEINIEFGFEKDLVVISFLAGPKGQALYIQFSLTHSVMADILNFSAMTLKLVIQINGLKLILKSSILMPWLKFDT